MENKVLEIIKRRLGVVESTFDDLITDYIEQIEVKIKRYCNIPSVPEDLRFVWASMVIDVLVDRHPNEEAFKKNVDSSCNNMSIGKFSVSKEKKNDRSSRSANLTFDEILQSYKPELNSYKRLRSI